MKSDFLIVHAYADLDRASKLCTQLNSFGYSGSCCNELSLEQDLQNVRHVLFCISTSFSNKAFLQLKKTVTNKWLKARAFRINPVYLDEHVNVDDNAKSHFYGLMQFTGLYYNTKHFDSDVKKEFEKYKR